MKRTIITAIMFFAPYGFIPTPCCAGVLGVVKHLAVDGYHGVKYQVLGVCHGAKHAASDLKTVLK